MRNSFEEVLTQYEDLYARAEESRREGARKLEKIDAQIAMLKEQIAKLYDEREATVAHYNSFCFPNWLDDIARPLAKALADASDFQRHTVTGPCGIASRTFLCVWSCDPEPKGKAIAIQPVFDEDKISFVYETGEVENTHPSGSLGAESGLNFVTAPLPDSLDEILAVMSPMPASVIRRYEKRDLYRGKEESSI